MMLSIAVTAFALSLVPQALAQASAYGQCGGIGWSGATTCTSGWSCTVINPYYSQCLQGSGSTTSTASTSTATTTTTKSTTTTTTTTTRTTTSSSTSTSTAPTGTATGYQIRSVEQPVFHFYLQDNNGTVVLGPEASADRYAITGGYIKSTSNNLYLNAATSASTSYKALSWGTSATTLNWQLEGDTIILNNPRTLAFIACPTSNSNLYALYLQQGGDKPSSSCTNVDLHLPCLC